MKHLKLEELSIEQKLGMVYCARPQNEEDLDFVIELVKKRALGCVQLPPTKPDFVTRVREAADYPILIACDTETGFPGSDLPPVPLMALSACNNEEYYRVFAKGIATDARKAGFNVTWSPVVDILRCNGANKVHRHLSDDPERVAKAAEIMARVYKKNGYLAGGKHYPGGKDKPYDGHMAGIPSDKTVQELEEFDLIPYKRLMEQDLLPSIMTCHLTFKNIDPEHPATLSPKVQKIIRDMGFDGVNFTDSFAMMPILQKYGEENVIGMAVAAGNDIVLPNYRTPDRICFGYLQKNYEDGMIPEERLNEAVRRVLTAQEFVSAEPEEPDTFTEEDRAVFNGIARDCITAICDEGVEPALSKDKSKLFVIVTETPTPENEIELEISTPRWYFPDKIIEKIRQEFPDAGIECIPEFQTRFQNERVLLAAANYDEVVFITVCNTLPYLGTDCLTRRVEGLIDCVNLIGKLGAVVHFGNPYALQPLMHVSRKLFGYIMPDAQPYAIEVLSGKIPAKGTLPFYIDFQ